MSSIVKRVYKIIVAGDGGIGKTTLLKKFCDGEYKENQRLTIGMSIFVKLAKIDSKKVSLQIWDFGGQNQFRFLLNTYVSGAIGAILGFDMKRRKSFLDLKKWIELLRSFNPNIPIVLIATKNDLGYHPTLSPEAAKNFVRANDLLTFTETSSKENYNVEKPFKLLLKHIEDTNGRSIEFLSTNKN
jgi:small GTP-binding protein